MERSARRVNGFRSPLRRIEDLGQKKQNSEKSIHNLCGDLGTGFPVLSDISQGLKTTNNFAIHPIPDIWTTFVPAKMVQISEKSIKQKQKAIERKYWNKMVHISEKSIYPKSI